MSKFIKGALIVALLAVALVIRIAPAPYSSGSDIPQFAGFADTFLRHGLCFFKYTDASNTVSEGWPYNWAYPYGPIWILLIAPLRIISPDPVEFFWSGGHYFVYVPINWVVSVKSLLITADILVGVILIAYLWRKHSFAVGIAGGAAYLLNPMTIYISSIYGMFDQIVSVFLILSLILFDTRKLSSGFLASLALLTKQVVLPSMIPMAVKVLGELKTYKRFILGGLLGLAILVAPFILGCLSSPLSVFSAMMFYQNPGYTHPVCYSFNGLSSLATYLHDVTGGDYTFLIKYWIIPYIILQAIALHYFLKTDDLIGATYLSYAAFIATFWRINHQYLVPLIALAVLAVPQIMRRWRTVSVVTVISSVLLPAVWPIMFPTSWWFHVHIKNPSTWWISLIDKLTLMVFESGAYVAYSLVLTFSLYLTIVVWWFRGSGIFFSCLKSKNI